MGCNLGQPRTLNPKLPTEKARDNPTYITEPPKGSVITYRGQGREGLKTGEWAPSLPCLPLHPVTAAEGLRTGGERGRPSHGQAQPAWCQAPGVRVGGGWQTQKPSRSGLSQEEDSARGSRKARLPCRVRKNEQGAWSRNGWWAEHLLQPPRLR